jgi:hypothetical protein
MCKTRRNPNDFRRSRGLGQSFSLIFFDVKAGHACYDFQAMNDDISVVSFAVWLEDDGQPNNIQLRGKVPPEVLIDALKFVRRNEFARAQHRDEIDLELRVRTETRESLARQAQKSVDGAGVRL